MTRTRLLAFAVLLLFAGGISKVVAAQDDNTSTPVRPATQAGYQGPGPGIVRQAGTVIMPKSSVERPEDAGIRFHTNYQLFVPAGRSLSSINPNTPLLSIQRPSLVSTGLASIMPDVLRPTTV
jgi:hypothetical protein